MDKDMLSQLWNINRVGHEATNDPAKTSKLFMGLEEDTRMKTL